MTNAIADLQAALDEAEDENDALLARLADIELAAGGGEAVPLDVVKRLSDGENPIRVWREYRGLALRALAAAAGISHALLSEIETGKKDGSIRTLAALARALSVDLDDLLPWEGEVPGPERERLKKGVGVFLARLRHGKARSPAPEES